MKNFIITAGALLLILTIMQYQFTLNHLLSQKAELKYAADEAAATAGLCIDAQMYGEGNLCFDKEKARKRAEQSLEYNLNVSENDDVKWEIHFEEGEDQRPKVIVRVHQGKMNIVSVYEHVPYRN